MTFARVLMAIMILIGIIMIVVAVLGALYWGLLLPLAVFLAIGGIFLIIITIIIYFLLI